MPTGGRDPFQKPCEQCKSFFETARLHVPNESVVLGGEVARSKPLPTSESAAAYDVFQKVQSPTGSHRRNCQITAHEEREQERHLLQAQRVRSVGGKMVRVQHSAVASSTGSKRHLEEVPLVRLCVQARNEDCSTGTFASLWLSEQQLNQQGIFNSQRRRKPICINHK